MKLSWLETVVTSTAIGVGGVVHIGGIGMTMTDYAIALFLSCFCSFAAGITGGGGGKAFWLNFVLGVVVGYLLAHVVVIAIGMLPVSTQGDGLLFSLAPIFSLFAAKFARTIISDDEIADEILDGIKRKVGMK